MVNKPNMIRVNFWIDKELKKEIDAFARSHSISCADVYKAGALMLKNMILHPPEINLNIFTRSFKDFENKQMQKKIRKAYTESRSIY